MSPAPEQKKRLGEDRRKQPTSILDAFRFGGRRVRNRRSDEVGHLYFVDRFSATMLAFVLVLLAFTVVDGVITLDLLDVDCQEVNPAMRYLLSKGPVPFLLGKYTLTAACLPFLLIFKNYRLFGTPVRVGHLIPIFVILYLALIIYQIYLLQMLFTD